MYKEKGYLSQKEYSALMPSEERFDKGAVAIIECLSISHVILARKLVLEML